MKTLMLMIALTSNAYAFNVDDYDTIAKQESKMYENGNCDFNKVKNIEDDAERIALIEQCEELKEDRNFFLKNFVDETINK